MRVFYISGNRSEERLLLEYSTGTEFKEISVHLREDVGHSLIKKIHTCFSIMRTFKPEMILLEWVGLGAVISVLLKKIYKVPLLARVKGDVWIEYEQIRYGLPFNVKIAKLLNHVSCILILKNADVVLPISSNIEKLIHKRLGPDKTSRVVHIPYKELRTGVEAFNPGKRFILTVTNFSFWEKVKPLIGAIPAVYTLLKKHDVEWHIVGGGDQLERCRNLAEGYGDYVKFSGWKDSQYYYNGKPLFLLYISGLDGLPNVALEASLNKIPVVMNRDCPAAEFIEDGVDGILIDLDSPNYVMATLEDMLTNGGLRNRLSKATYDHVKERFSVATVSRSLEDALAMCLTGHKAGRG